MSIQSRPTQNEAARAAGERGIVVSLVQGGMAERPEATEAAPADKYLRAFELLDSVSGALEFLEGRREQLESALVEMSQRAEAAVAASAGQAADWQRFAAALKTKSGQLEAETASLAARLGAAEEAREAAEGRAASAERRAEELQQLLRGLHGKVMSAFGQGSRAHDILSGLGTDAPAPPRAAAR